MAGIYFAFSTFIMSSLSAIEKVSGMSAMQSINDVILKSPFMILFFGTTILSIFFIVYGFLNLEDVNYLIIMCAGLVYFIGMFLCTIFFNVPLNNTLKDAKNNTDEGQLFWDEYLHTWTRWNHLRTVASSLSCGLLIYTIL